MILINCILYDEAIALLICMLLAIVLLIIVGAILNLLDKFNSRARRPRKVIMFGKTVTFKEFHCPSCNRVCIYGEARCADPQCNMKFKWSRSDKDWATERLERED